MKEKIMDDGGELDDPNPNCSTNLHGSNSTNIVGSFIIIDDLMQSSSGTCTHTHTCNPPGRDSPHTHTCYHTHTRFLATGDDQTSKRGRPIRPSGNREAVRKYREKKKAHAAFLEDQVKKLRAANQQLTRRLQRRAVLEAEAERPSGQSSRKDRQRARGFPASEAIMRQCWSLQEGHCRLVETDSPRFHPHLVGFGSSAKASALVSSRTQAE